MSAHTKVSYVEDSKNGDFDEHEHASHRLPMFTDSRVGRTKLTNANFMYHSADKGSLCYIVCTFVRKEIWNF